MAIDGNKGRAITGREPQRAWRVLAGALGLVIFAAVAAPMLVGAARSPTERAAAVEEEPVEGAISLEEFHLAADPAGFGPGTAGGAAGPAGPAGGWALGQGGPGGPADPEPAGHEVGEGQGQQAPEPPAPPEQPKNPCPTEPQDPAAAWLAVAPNPVQLKIGVYQGSFAIHNCGQLQTEWAALSKPSVALSEHAGNLPVAGSAS